MFEKNNFENKKIDNQVEGKEKNHGGVSKGIKKLVLNTAVATFATLGTGCKIVPVGIGVSVPVAKEKAEEMVLLDRSHTTTNIKGAYDEKTNTIRVTFDDEIGKGYLETDEIKEGVIKFSKQRAYTSTKSVSSTNATSTSSSIETVKESADMKTIEQTVSNGDYEVLFTTKTSDLDAVVLELDGDELTIQVDTKAKEKNVKMTTPVKKGEVEYATDADGKFQVTVDLPNKDFKTSNQYIDVSGKKVLYTLEVNKK